MLSRLKYCFLLILVAHSCKTVTDNKQAPEKSNESFLSAEFEQFYEQFHTDSSYQIDHIIFPLEGMTYDEDNNSIVKLWTPENWIMHKPFDDMGGTFTRSYTEFGGIISEKIIDDRNISNMERRFSKIQGEWSLIYYDPIHLTSN